MGNARDNETRQRIVDAASVLFRKKGLDGVNMRELAERADVNKGLLHYYFKTKEAVFREVFGSQVKLFYGEVGALLHAPGPLRDKVPVLVDNYFRMFGENPGLPAFVLFEMQRDPSIMVRIGVRDILQEVIAAVEPELKRAKLPAARASGMHFIMDVLGLCAFTFGTLPGVNKVMKFNKTQRAAYLLDRKTHIIALIRQGLKP